MTDLVSRLRSVIEQRRQLAVEASTQVAEVWLYVFDMCIEGLEHTNAAHARANDPQSVIALCDHALGVLERHQPHIARQGANEGEPICYGCSRGAEWYYASWPCDEIRALASAWRVEVE